MSKFRQILNFAAAVFTSDYTPPATGELRYPHSRERLYSEASTPQKAWIWTVFLVLLILAAIITLLLAIFVVSFPKFGSVVALLIGIPFALAKLVK